jgi:polysaccharide biosynthesis protein PslH
LDEVESMHILILTPRLPYPPHQGGAIRNSGIIRGLHDAGHKVTLLSFHENGVDPAATPLAELCAEIVTVDEPPRPPSKRLRDLVVTGQPDLARRLESETFRARLANLLSKTAFDLVQFEGLEMTGYMPAVRQRQPQAKLCYDAHNAEFALQQAIFDVERQTPRRLPQAAYSLIQARRIAYFERGVCQMADCVIAVSDEDAEALRPFSRDKRVEVVPNGIFADDYAVDLPHVDLGENVLVFTGKMDYRPNIDAMRWFTGSVLPRVREQIPDTKLYIVGQKPHRSLEALRDQPGVEITGWVQEVQPFLQAADVYVAPLRMGSGTRLKILEAMAAGCAVVATSTAASGLKDVRESLILMDGETGFAEAIVSLLQDPARRQALGTAAKRAVRQHYDWSVLIPCLLKIYKDIGLG